MKQMLMPFLLVLGLLFWGWSTQALWLGVLLSVVLFLGFAFKGKYDFEPSSFYQIANLGGLIVMAIFAFYWLDDRVSKAILPTLRLLPLALLPLLLMQYLSKQSKVPTSAVLFFQRGKPEHNRWFDISTLFLFVCLFSAGAIPHQDLAYYIGISVLTLTLLLVLHAHQHTGRLVIAFLVAQVVGIALVYGINDLQKRMEAKIHAWVLAYHDGNKAYTAIGDIGSLKLSDSIYVRIQADKPLPIPMLLREGTYQRYIRNEWYGGAWQDKNVPIVNEAWQLMETNRPLKHMRIYQSFDQAKQSLILPAHTVSIANLDVKRLQIRQGARVEAQGLPPFAAFDVFYAPQETMDAEVKRSDLHIGKAEAKAIAEVAKSLNLHHIKHTLGDARVVQVLHEYFMNQFTYSLWQDKVNTTDKTTALAGFLQDTKQGHCEYFATATVLLLREVGIPARYAVGYSVSEWYDGLYVVRGRDAHAWAVAWIDGQWIDVDNTPPDWFMLESQNTPAWQALSDWFFNLVFIIQKWRYSENERDNALWYVILAVLFVFLTYRVLRRVRTLDSKGEEALLVQDEVWQDLESLLNQAGYQRNHGETILQWFKRIQQGKWLPVAKLLYIKHYAARPLSSEEEVRLSDYILTMRRALQKEIQVRG